MTETKYQIINFYEFKNMDQLGPLGELRDALRLLMYETGIRGTIILADEGFNASLCGPPTDIAPFIEKIEQILKTTLGVKSSFHEIAPLRKIDVKIKPEIVTLKQQVDVGLGKGTHVPPAKWNELIERDDVLLLDARNSYEFKNGTFEGAVDPRAEKFSDLPSFIEKHLHPEQQKAVAMFCTGGIRCEKLAPYMRSLGFERVYQLDGGILRYLEETPPEDSKWTGECFVFDERRTVTETLEQGSGHDYSLRHKPVNE